MKLFDTADLRNVGLIGHGHCGKTTLAAALLFRSGAVNRLGRVEDGSTVTDFEPEEIERRISIGASLAHAEWNGARINILDLPGFGAFVHEARAALKVADAALCVVSGVSGIEVQTEKTWGYALEFRLPRAIVINKLDRERADFDRILAQVRERFGRGVAAVQIPIGSEAGFRGVIDLISMKAWTWAGEPGGPGREEPVPADLEEAARAARSALMESVAELDDTLMEHFFEHGELPEDEFLEGLHRGVREGRIVPVLAASALKGVGVDRLLDFVVTVLPAPHERDAARGTHPKTGAEVERPVAADAPLSMFVFKTIADPFAGRISLFRVMSGTVRADQVVHNFSRDHAEKLAGLGLLQGKELTKIQELRAGDLGAIAKLKDTGTGDTLGDPAHPVVYPAVPPPEGAMAFAIEPKTRGDDDKLSHALSRLIEEDPALHSSRDLQTHEMLLSGTGAVHIEVALARMKKKFGVDCVLHPPKVPYRETIRRRAEATARHKKQTGGHGQFAECRIAIEPRERGAGYEYVDKIFGGSISQGYRPAVDKGVQEAAQRGFLAGFPVSDLRVILLDGKEHTVDSSEMAFKIAGSMAFRECMQLAGATLLEPIMDVDIAAPDQYMGDIMGDLNSRRGRVQGMDSTGDGAQHIRARVPMAEMLTYAQILTSLTGGHGQFHMTLSHYDEVPAAVQQKIIAEAAKKRGADHA